MSSDSERWVWIKLRARERERMHCSWSWPNYVETCAVIRAGTWIIDGDGASIIIQRVFIFLIAHKKKTSKQIKPLISIQRNENIFLSSASLTTSLIAAAEVIKANCIGILCVGIFYPRGAARSGSGAALGVCRNRQREEKIARRQLVCRTQFSGSVENRRPERDQYHARSRNIPGQNILIWLVLFVAKYRLCEARLVYFYITVYFWYYSWGHVI